MTETILAQLRPIALFATLWSRRLRNDFRKVWTMATRAIAQSRAALHETPSSPFEGFARSRCLPVKTDRLPRYVGRRMMLPEKFAVRQAYQTSPISAFDCLTNGRMALNDTTSAGTIPDRPLIIHYDTWNLKKVLHKYFLNFASRSLFINLVTGLISSLNAITSYF